MPIEPASSWRRAISGVFGVLKCGRSLAGLPANHAAIAAMFSSTTSRSSSRAGVSTSCLCIVHSGTHTTPEEPGAEDLMAVKAYVLIVTDPVETRNVLRRIREIAAVKASYEVMGPYDIIIEIEVED